MSKSLDLLKQRMLLLGIEPKRSLGQNFLVSDHVIQKICRAVDELKPDTLYEVGPGLGALTTDLKEKYSNYHLIELDRMFAEFWRGEKMSVFEEDALQMDWQKLPGQGRRILVSNLPYQISSSLVIERTLDLNPLDGMVLMFQKEVAQRLRAKPRSEEYGMLTVFAQLGWEIENLLEASSGDFFPPPRVASRVLVFRKKEAAIKNKKKFLSFVKAAYSQRRKLLLNNLVGVMNGDHAQHQKAFEGLKIGLKARAEELSLQQMIDLFLELGYDSKA